MKIINTVDIPLLNDYLSQYDTINTYDDEQLSSCDIYIGSIKKRELAIAKNLKFLQLSMAGSDSYKEEMFNEGCKVCNATGTFGIGISEYVIASLIFLMRKFSIISYNQRNCHWDREGVFAKDSIYGSTVLLLGLGNIGMECAKRLKAFGCYLIGVRRHTNDKPDIIDEIYSLADLDEIIGRCDIVIASLPQYDKTRNILTQKQFDLMKDGSYLVNVGRGSLLNLDDLYLSLKNRHLSGAVLDVFEKEPLAENHPIWKMDNVFISPHIAGGMDLDINKELFAKLAIENIESFIHNKPLKNEVDFNTGYRKYQSVAK